MRPWSEKVYGISPEQVIGSSIKVEYEVHDGTPVLVRLPGRGHGSRSTFATRMPGANGPMTGSPDLVVSTRALTKLRQKAGPLWT
jgi:hypothetical protein